MTSTALPAVDSEPVPVSERFCEMLEEALPKRDPVDTGSLPRRLWERSSPADWVGRRLAGVEIGHLVSKSPLCWLFLGIHPQGQHLRVALLPPSAVEDEDVRRRFLRQVELLDRVRCPWTQVVLARGCKDGLLYAIIADPGGPSVQRLVRQCGRLTGPAAIELALCVGQAMAESHARRIVHAGLDPASLFLPPTGGLVFGLVERVVMDLGEIPSEVGLAHRVRPPFFSPEQALGEDLDERSDVYVAGALLYYLLTGQPHFRGSRKEVAVQMQTTPPPSVRSFNPRVSRTLDRFVHSCLALYPWQRPADIHAFNETLTQMLQDKGWERRTRRMERPAPGPVATDFPVEQVHAERQGSWWLSSA